MSDMTTARQPMHLISGQAGALSYVAGVFRHYAQIHAEKGTPEGVKKAQANAELAQFCEMAMNVEPSGRRRMGDYQVAVFRWLVETFGPGIATDPLERACRFLEEAMELAQAVGMSADQANTLVDYVWGRDVGQPSQEVGGVMVCLAALCHPLDIDMEAAALAELDRIESPVTQEKIRSKHRAKYGQGITGNAPPLDPRPGAAGAECDPDQPVMIFSGEYGAFWRARGEGYTIRADMAGQWPRAKAMAEIAGAGPEKMLSLVPLADTLAPVPK